MDEDMEKIHVNLHLTKKQVVALEKLTKELGDINRSNLIRLAISNFIREYDKFIRNEDK